MADYPVLFDGMMGTIQTTTVPEPIMRNIIAPPLPSDGLAARKAPLGLRRIEAALLGDGFRREDVILCTPENLEKCVGPRTGLSRSLPQIRSGAECRTARCRTWPAERFTRTPGTSGCSFNSKRRRGRSHSKSWRARRAWQLAQNEAARHDLGIDTVVEGYAEAQIAPWFHELADGRELPPVINSRSSHEARSRRFAARLRWEWLKSAAAAARVANSARSRPSE